MNFEGRLGLLLAASLVLAACSGGEGGDAQPDDGVSMGEEDMGQPQEEEMGPPVEDEAAPYLEDDSARMWLRGDSWYPQDYLELDASVEALLEENASGPPRDAFAVVVPHAGLSSSGALAAKVYAQVNVPDVVILLAPKHHTDGESPAMWDGGPFLVPGHALHVREDLSEAYMAALDDGEVTYDRDAFSNPNTHPLEMQLPFLSTINPDVELVPMVTFDVSTAHYDGFDVARVEAHGEALADLVRSMREGGEDVLVVATTDLVHRVSLEQSNVQDPKLMEHITALDVQGLYDYVTGEEVSICGEISVSIMMHAARELGHEEAELVGRGSSYDKNGDAESVVGYGGAIVWE